MSVVLFGVRSRIPTLDYYIVLLVLPRNETALLNTGNTTIQNSCIYGSTNSVTYTRNCLVLRLPGICCKGEASVFFQVVIISGISISEQGAHGGVVGDSISVS